MCSIYIVHVLPDTLAKTVKINIDAIVLTSPCMNDGTCKVNIHVQIASA